MIMAIRAIPARPPTTPLTTGTLTAGVDEVPVPATAEVVVEPIPELEAVGLEPGTRPTAPVLEDVVAVAVMDAELDGNLEPDDEDAASELEPEAEAVREPPNPTEPLGFWLDVNVANVFEALEAPNSMDVFVEFDPATEDKIPAVVMEV